MAVNVASLRATLSLDKQKYEKDLKDVDKGLDKAKGSLGEFRTGADKLSDALGDATNKGRLGLSEVDQGAINAKGSLSAMMSSLGGGAAAAAESTLENTNKNLGKLGKSADETRAKFGSMTGSLQSRMAKAGREVKEFGDDAKKEMDDFISSMREAADEAEKMGDSVDDAGKKTGGLGGGLKDLIPGLDKLGDFMGGGGPFALLAGGAIALGTAIFDAGMEVQGAMNLIEARTGATGEKLIDLGNVARDVYRRNFGESMEDAANAVIQVNQILGETGEVAEKSAIRALVMRDVFGIDIPESLRAVRSATRQFGNEAGQIFDMMAVTIQRVGDPAGDLADTINEYSTDFAQAGFSVGEFFGILNTGVSLGARNFDILADLVREFTIRIIDGSDKTKDALNRLFAETGRGGQEYFELEIEIDKTTQAIEENEKALKQSEGAYEAQRRVVNDLESQLSEARRELDKLSRPNLKGMDEFDDKLFELDQRAKQLQLALLDLEEDTPAFEDTQQRLEELNKEMDRVALERDLTIAPQLREIEKLATEGREPILSYEEALAAVAAQKNKIAELETTFADQKKVLEPLASEYERLADENERLIGLSGDLVQQLEGMSTPADEFLKKLSEGEITQRDALSMVIQMLKEVENQVVADQIAVELMGTKAEELGLDIITALDPAVNRMTDFEGATMRAADAVNQGLKPAWQTFWRDMRVGLGEMFNFAAEGGFDLGDIFDDLVDAISSPLDFQKKFGEGLQGLDTFQTGGIVPGSPGQAVPIIAHAGERILTPEQQQSGGVTVIVQGSINGEAHLQEVVMDAFGQLNMALASGAR